MSVTNKGYYSVFIDHIYHMERKHEICPLTEIYKECNHCLQLIPSDSINKNQFYQSVSISICFHHLCYILENCFQILHLILSTNDMHFLVERHGRTHNLGYCCTLAKIVKSDHLGNPKQVRLIVSLFSQRQVTQRVWVHSRWANLSLKWH